MRPLPLQGTQPRQLACIHDGGGQTAMPMAGIMRRHCGAIPRVPFLLHEGRHDTAGAVIGQTGSKQGE
jgi:hypothetical protein